METVRLFAHTTADGRLLLDLPASMKDLDVEVTVIAQSKDDVPRDALGWPIGFWERFAGSMPDLQLAEDPFAEDVEEIR